MIELEPLHLGYAGDLGAGAEGERPFQGEIRRDDHLRQPGQLRGRLWRAADHRRGGGRIVRVEVSQGLDQPGGQVAFVMEADQRECRLAAFAAESARELGHFRRTAVADLQHRPPVLGRAQLAHGRFPAPEVGCRIDLLRRVSGDDQRPSARHASAEQRQLQS